MNPVVKKVLKRVAIFIAILYLPAAFALFDEPDMAEFLAGAPGFVVLVLVDLFGGVRIFSREYEFLWHAAQILLSLLFVGGLAFIAARSRGWMIFAIVLGLLIGGFTGFAFYTLPKLG